MRDLKNLKHANYYKMLGFKIGMGTEKETETNVVEAVRNDNN